MKIQYVSDLHLESSKNSKFFEKYPLEVLGDIMILAGDIIYLENAHNNTFLQWCSDHFKETYWLCGNHEYYGKTELNETPDSFSYKIYENVTLLNNKIISFDSLNIIFSTGWSCISPHNEVSVKKNLNDYQCIYYNNTPLSVKTFNNLSKIDWNFIESALESSDTTNNKTIVATHYLPSFSLICEQYKNDLLNINEAFAINKDFLFSKYCIDYWIYGHSHAIPSIKTLGITKCVTNPFGYFYENQQLNYKHSKILDVH